MDNEEMMDHEQFREHIKNADIASRNYTPKEEKGENKMKKLNRKRMLKGIIVAGAGVALYRLGERNGFDLGYELGELNGFKEAVKAITENTVDAYNLGDLESFGE